MPLVDDVSCARQVRRQHQGADDGFPRERLEIERRIVARPSAIVAECPQDEMDLDPSLRRGPRAHRDRAVRRRPRRVRARPPAAAPARRSASPTTSSSILQLGRMVPRKGVDNVIRARRAAARPTARRACWSSAASRAARRERVATRDRRLAALADACGVADRVIFAGQRQRTSSPPTTRACRRLRHDAVVRAVRHHAARSDGVGTPVIGSAVGGISTRSSTASPASWSRRAIRPRWPTRLASCKPTRGSARDGPRRRAPRAHALHLGPRRRADLEAVYQGVLAETAPAARRRRAFPAVDRARGECARRERGGLAGAGRPLRSGREQRAARHRRAPCSSTRTARSSRTCPTTSIRRACASRRRRWRRCALLADAGYALVVVTNQPGLAAGRFTRRRIRAAASARCADRVREEAGVELAGFYACPHAPSRGRRIGLPVPQARARACCARPRSRIASTSRARWMVGDILDDVEAGPSRRLPHDAARRRQRDRVAALAAARAATIAAPTCSRRRS